MIEIVTTGLIIIGLCLAVALVIYLLRGRALERRLAILDAIADLSQRVAQMENAIHANATAPIERKLDLVSQKLKEIEGGISAQVPPSVSAPPPRDLAETEQEFIVRTLTGQGYSRIKITGENELPSGPREVRVEATRGDLMLKGSVFISNGRIGETKLTPIYELFP